jgi:hypothetical protein
MPERTYAEGLRHAAARCRAEAYGWRTLATHDHADEVALALGHIAYDLEQQAEEAERGATETS